MISIKSSFFTYSHIYSPDYAYQSMYTRICLKRESQEECGDVFAAFTQKRDNFDKNKNRYNENSLS